jgi:hypothetical protein
LGELILLFLGTFQKCFWLKKKYQIDILIIFYDDFHVLMSKIKNNSKKII